MTKHVSIDVFDYNRKKLCNLYDSSLTSPGQAHEIVHREALGDTPRLSFLLPRMVDRARNFRWDFIRAEYLIRLTVDEIRDWFIIDQPSRSKSSAGIGTEVNCSHLSMQLKTRNLYKTFDEHNGIGTLPHLMRQALMGTAWTFDEAQSDVFYEKSDPDAGTGGSATEKVRSLTSDGKEGAYQLVFDICALFDAFPIFDGENRSVRCLATTHFGSLGEMQIGKNLQSLDVRHDSQSVITRLYVEGMIDEDNYVGIEKVNPTGLGYLQDFGYYKALGLYTEDHEAATTAYYAQMREITGVIRENYSTLLSLQNALNSLWGQPDGIYYPILYTSGTPTMDTENAILFGEATEEDKAIHEGDSVIVQTEAEEAGGQKPYREAEIAQDGTVALSRGDLWAIKFKTAPAANIGALQVSLDTKKQLLSGAYEDLQKEEQSAFRKEERVAYYQEQIAGYQAQIRDFYYGSNTMDEWGNSLVTSGLYERMETAVATMLQAHEANDQYLENNRRQDRIEAEYAQAMGDMLREGYWNDSNYVEGQEMALYLDALERMRIMSRPRVSYAFDYVSLMDRADFVALNQEVHLYDMELGINDLLHVSAITRHLDNPAQDDVEISNEDVSLTGGSLDSVLGRMAQLADLIDQKNALYKRAGAINADGSLYVERLEGQINILQNRLLSQRSNWYTDDNGSMIFESSSGRSAMMLTGEGFMIANGRKQNGVWNWRTFGTGEGFSADAITAGFLSADRIEAGSISAAKLDANVGAEINLTENATIRLLAKRVDTASSLITVRDTPPENPANGQLWLDTSDGSGDAFYRYDGQAGMWIRSTLSKEDLAAIADTLSTHQGQIEILSDALESKVSLTTYNTDIENKADKGWVSKEIAASQKHSEKEILNRFSETTDYLADAVNNVNAYQEQISAWQRFDASGMELGRSDSVFKAKMDNEKLSFTEEDREVAFIGNKEMNITDARVTSSLYMGKRREGAFEWRLVGKGLGMTWKA